MIEMKTKIFNCLFLVSIMMLLGLSFTACSSDEDGGNGVKGLYMTPAYEGWKGHNFCKGLDFINGNTVKVYDYICDYKYWEEPAGSSSLGYGNWYFQTGCDTRATYTIVDNKVYIHSEGMILTIEDDKLYTEGGGNPYTKCK